MIALLYKSKRFNINYSDNQDSTRTKMHLVKHFELHELKHTFQNIQPNAGFNRT